MVGVCPMSIPGALPNILRVVFASQGNPSGLVQGLCDLIEDFPQQTEQFNQQFIEILAPLPLVIVDENTTQEILSCKAAAIKGLALLAPESEVFQKGVNAMLWSISIADQVSASDSLGIAALSPVPLDFSPVLPVLFDELMRQSSAGIACSMIRALSLSLYSNPTLATAWAENFFSDFFRKAQLLDAARGLFQESALLQATFSGKLNCLTQPGESVKASMDIFSAVLNLFVFVLAIFGSGWAELAPFFQGQFIHLLTGQDRSSCLKAHAILGLGVLASAVPSADLFSLAAANACQAINVGNTVVRKNAFDALNILTKANAAGLTTHQAAIHATIDAALHFGQTGDGVFESAAVLWCTSAVADFLGSIGGRCGETASANESAQR
jgi:hypothetical protein